MKRARKTTRGRKQAVTAPACAEHFERFDLDARDAPAPTEAHVTTVVPPLCSSCGAEIAWVTVLKVDGGSGRMPVDRRPVRGREPRAGMVARSPRTGRAKVLRKVDLASPWVKRVELLTSHFMTCKSAALHRRRKAAA